MTNYSAIKTEAHELQVQRCLRASLIHSKALPAQQWWRHEKAGYSSACTAFFSIFFFQSALYGSLWGFVPTSGCI